MSDKTKRAHVWPASLGGRLHSRSTCCDDCNAELSFVEDDLQLALLHVNASVGALKDDRTPIEVQIKIDDREYTLGQGFADMNIDGMRFDAETKTMNVPLPAGRDSQVHSIARAFWDQGLGPDDVEKLTLTEADPRPEFPKGPVAHEHSVAFGGSKEHKRAIVKIALELLASHRHDLAIRPELSEVRRFALHGEGSFGGKVDPRSQGSGLLVNEGAPELRNSIECWTFQRTVFFRIVFLGVFPFTGSLCANWSGDAFRTVYWFDAQDPSCRATSFESGDGPNLSIWFDDLKEEAATRAVAALEAASLRLATSRTRPEPEAPPPLDELRQLVRDRLAALPPKRKRKPRVS